MNRIILLYGIEGSGHHLFYDCVLPKLETEKKVLTSRTAKTKKEKLFFKLIDTKILRPYSLDDDFCIKDLISKLQKIFYDLSREYDFILYSGSFPANQFFKLFGRYRDPLSFPNIRYFELIVKNNASISVVHLERDLYDCAYSSYRRFNNKNLYYSVAMLKYCEQALHNQIEDLKSDQIIKLDFPKDASQLISNIKLFYKFINIKINPRETKEQIIKFSERQKKIPEESNKILDFLKKFKIY